MSNEEIRFTIRTAQLPMLRTFIVGTVAVMGTVIGGVVYIKSNIGMHSYQIEELKAADVKTDLIDNQQTKDIASNTADLMLFKAHIKIK